MKRIVSVLLVAFALILGGCGAGLDGVNDDYKFDDLKGQISNINTSIDGNDNVIAGIQDNVAALQTQCAADSAAIADLQSRVAALEAGEQNDVTQAQIVELQTQITNLQNQVDNINITINELNVTLYGDGENPGLVAEVEALREDLSALQDAVDAQGSSIEELQSDIDRLYGKVCGLSRKVCVLFSKLNALAGNAATFGFGEPTDNIGVGFYLDIDTGKVYKWGEEGWSFFGQLTLPTVPDVDALKAPMFVVADGLSGGKVKVSWTSVDGATSYVIYAMRYSHGVISTASVGQTNGLTITFDKNVETIVPILTVVHEDPPSFGDAYDLTYVVVAVDAQGNQGNSSYAVGPLTSNSH